MFVRTKRRETGHVALAVGILLVLVAYRLLTELVAPVRSYLDAHSILPLSATLVNVIFLWLLLLLWLAYRRWAGSVLYAVDLDRVFASISPDVLLVVAPDRRIIMCNESARTMFGYEPDEVVGQRTELLYFDRRVSGEKHELYRHLERVGFHVGYATGRRKDGATFPLEIITGSMRGQSGVVILIRDITERRDLEMRMQQLQKMESLGVLGGGVAHDFNNLLAGILGFADLALTELPPESPAYGHIREVVASSRRAADLCAKLLTYSGQGDIALRPLEAARLVRAMGEQLRGMVAPNAELVIEAGDSLPAIRADETQLRQVVANLVANASEALGDRPGRITVSAGIVPCTSADLRSALLGEGLPEGPYVFLRVADTGAGMDDRTKARMFDPFFSTKFTGRGLGLTTVLGIVRAHSGAIRVETAPGQGTVITVLLPASPQPSAGAACACAGPSARALGVVLAMDEDEMARAATASLLERMGYEALATPTLSGARELLGRRTDVVAVILGCDHSAAAGCVAELRQAGCRLPIVVGGLDVPRDGAPAGNGTAFARKPYRIDTLGEALRVAASSV